MKTTILAVCSLLIVALPALSDDKVCFYEYNNYRGKSVCITLGEKQTETERDSPFFASQDLKDTVSSMTVPKNIRVDLYQHKGFKGLARTVIGSNEPELYDISDDISSIKVFRVSLNSKDLSNPPHPRLPYCQLIDQVITFKDTDWPIISPTRVNIKEAEGPCSMNDLNINNNHDFLLTKITEQNKHEYHPQCVALKYEPITVLLYRYYYKRPIYVTLENAVATEAGCRVIRSQNS